MSEPREDEVLTRGALLKRVGSVVAAGLLSSAAGPPGAALEKPDPPKVPLLRVAARVERLLQKKLPRHQPSFS